MHVASNIQEEAAIKDQVTYSVRVWRLDGREYDLPLSFYFQDKGQDLVRRAVRLKRDLQWRRGDYCYIQQIEQQAGKNYKVMTGVQHLWTYDAPAVANPGDTCYLCTDATVEQTCWHCEDRRNVVPHHLHHPAGFKGPKLSLPVELIEVPEWQAA